MAREMEKKCLEILAEAANRTVGTGFVHAAITKASESLSEGDYDRAGKAFRLLSERETKRVRNRALEDAMIFRDHGVIPDPMVESMGNPAYAHVRHSARKLGTGIG